MLIGAYGGRMKYTLGHNCVIWWLVPVRHQAIIWTSAINASRKGQGRIYVKGKDQSTI